MRNIQLLALLAAASLFLFTGCSTVSSPQPENAGGAVVQTNASQQSAGPDYDFQDIEVPAEMSLQSDESFIMQTPQIKAGTLVYTGWVDPLSLFNFYLNTMPANNWQPLSYFKYGRYLLVFQKPGKVSVIRIHKARFSTRLEIWVSPSAPQPASNVSERVLPQ